MLKSVCRVRFVTYRGAFDMALRILDWDFYMMNMLELLGHIGVSEMIILKWIYKK
jgi:hypothetical protein